jgi:tetratricopeptide (TPR) repeat protein
MEIEAYHDRIRETIIEGLAAQEMRRIHRHLALALESSGRAEPETLAVHFQATKEMIRAREYVTSAAHQAEEVLAFERAARLYRKALNLLPEDRHQGSDQRYRLQVRLGAALANAGRSRDAANTYIQAVGVSGTADPVEVQRRAAEKLLISGHIERGLAILRHVLRTLGMELEPPTWRSPVRLWWYRLRLRLRGFEFKERVEAKCSPELLRRIDACWSVEIGLCLVDVQYASEFHARHLLLALEAGEPQRIARGLAMEVFFGALDGGTPKRAAAMALEPARDLAARVEGSYAAGLTEMAAGMRLCSLGHWEEAYGRLREAEIHLLETHFGVAWELDTVHHFRVLAMLGLGQLQDLFEEMPHLLERARDRGDLYLEIHLVHWVESFRYLVTDRPTEAREVLQETLHKWAYEGFHYQHFGQLYAEVQVALYCGRGEEAWGLVNSRWREFARSGIQRIDMVLIQALDLRARAALSAAASCEVKAAQEQLLTQVETDAREIERAGSNWALGLAHLLRAGVSSLRGQPDGVQEQLEVAITAFEVEGMLIHSAVASRRRLELHCASEEASQEASQEALAENEDVLRSVGIHASDPFAAMLAPGRYIS